MSSEDLHLTDEPTEEVDISSATSALEALTVQSDTDEVSSDLLLHTNDSRCAPTSVDNTDTQIISSHLEETDQSKTSQEHTCDVNVSECKEVSAATAEVEETDNAIAGEEDSSLTECDGSSGNQSSNLMKLTNTEKELLKEQLKFLQCPFTWNINNLKNIKITTETVIANCNDKLNLLEEEEEKDDVEEEFKWWRIFILTLVLCHEEHVSRNYSEALAKLQECENLINKCQSNEKSDTFFQNIKEALVYVVNASKCHLLFSLNMFNDAVKLMEGMSRYEDMNKQNMAAVVGVRSAMLMEYGYDGTKAALEYAEKALSLNGNEPEWSFLYGKLLGRIRRAENYTEIPTEKELSALEKAVADRKNAARIIFLAQAYREAASRAFAKNRNNMYFLKDTITNMNQKSLQLYWEALRLNENNARINIRCAAGLSKLPPPFRDLKKAEECIIKALMMTQNNAMALHTAGYIYEKLSKVGLAENYYKKAGELGAYGACMDLLRLKFRANSNYDPMPELERMLQQFTENNRIQDIYLEMGSYQFYCKNNILTALDYWMKGIEKDPMAEKLKSHKCCSRDMRTPVNLYKLIANQIQLALKQKGLTDENAMKLHQMLLYCKEKYPNI